MIRVKLTIGIDVVVTCCDTAQGDCEELIIYLYDFFKSEPWCFIECRDIMTYKCALLGLVQNGYFDFDQPGYSASECLPTD